MAIQQTNCAWSLLNRATAAAAAAVNQRGWFMDKTGQQRVRRSVLLLAHFIRSSTWSVFVRMAHQAPNIVKPYTEGQKSHDIPNEEEHETMVIVLGRFVGLQPDKSSKLIFFPLVYLFIVVL